MKIYLHKACFDGVASAAVATWILQRLKKEEPNGFELVDYDISQSWSTMHLDPRACVVDFLYHPNAMYWWDHHETSFSEPKLQQHYEKRQSTYVFWDPNRPSCAGLIAACARQSAEELPPQLMDTIRWADKLDSASYISAEEAVRNATAARQIALSFHVDSSLDYHSFLIRSMQDLWLDEIVKHSPCRERSEEALQRYSTGLELMRKRSRLEEDIVVYDLDLHSEIVDRMMPFFLYPQANYSLGIWRSSDRTKVTCNASPWRKPSGPNLGRVFGSYGGGGHRDVGSVILPKGSGGSAERLLREIASAIRASRKKSKEGKTAFAGRS